MGTLVSTSEWRQQLRSPVAVLLGGHSAEREVSLQSGEAVMRALTSANIDAEAVDTKSGDWLATIEKNFRHVFIALHGGDGEDGTVQAALEKIDVTYTGSGVAASALAMDKIQTKELWRQRGLPTPEFVKVKGQIEAESIINNMGQVIVKPVAEGSSIGMGVAKTAAELEKAIANAKQFSPEIMIEQWIEGPEFTVAILDGAALSPIRLETDNSFYDYEAKYISNDTRYICPCGLSAGKEQEIKELAIEAFQSVGCKGWGRVDFMQDKAGAFYLLEVNTVPGMTSHSLVPMAAKHDGMSFDQLVEEILRLSVVEGQ